MNTKWLMAERMERETGSCHGEANRLREDGNNLDMEADYLYAEAVTLYPGASNFNKEGEGETVKLNFADCL